MILNNSGNDQSSLLSSRLKDKASGKSEFPTKADSIDTDNLRRSIVQSSPLSDELPVFAADGSRPNSAAHKKKRNNRQERLSARKPKRVRPAQDYAPLQDAAEYDAELERDANKKELIQQHRQATWGKFKVVIQIVLVVLSVYIGFLIFGVVETRYVYDENGQVVPEILEVKDLESLNEYNALSAYYLRARIMYEDALLIDYKLSVSPDSALALAMDYTGMLENVAKLVTDISAGADTASTKYSPLYSQLLSWVKTDIAVYLQEMSAAITKDSADSAAKALSWRTTMYNDFSKLSENMYYLGVSTKGATNLDIYDWSPDSFSLSLAEGGD